MTKSPAKKPKTAEREAFRAIVKLVEEGKGITYRQLLHRLPYAAMLFYMRKDPEQSAASVSRHLGFSEYEARLFEKMTKDKAIELCKKQAFED